MIKMICLLSYGDGVIIWVLEPRQYYNILSKLLSTKLDI